MSGTNGILLALVALLLAQQVACESSSIENVMNKMEIHAKEPSQPSGLSMEEIKAALEEWSGLSDEDQERLRNNSLIRLTIDFVVQPLKLAELQFEQVIPEEYVERAEEAYRLFRGAYANKQTFDGGNIAPAFRFLDIYKTFVTKQKKRELLSKKHFVLARNEYKSWLAKFNEITAHNDVYTLIPYLKKLFNYFNHPLVDTLAKAVFPVIDDDKSTVDDLLQLYARELKARHNIVILDEGGWKYDFSSTKAQVAAPNKKPETAETSNVATESAIIDNSKPLEPSLD